MIVFGSKSSNSAPIVHDFILNNPSDIMKVTGLFPYITYEVDDYVSVPLFYPVLWHSTETNDLQWTLYNTNRFVNIATSEQSISISLSNVVSSEAVNSSPAIKKLYRRNYSTR